MSDIDWDEHSTEEIVRARETAPRVFGPWAPWEGGLGWDRRELHPGPCWREGGMVTVAPTIGGTFFVAWWDGKEPRHVSGFGTAEEAMARGDAWLKDAGCRCLEVRHKTLPLPDGEMPPLDGAPQAVRGMP